MYRADPQAYALLRQASEFPLCVDPTSPHTQLGGQAFCSRHNILTKASLVQHCGPQPGGKTAAIGRHPPPSNDAGAWGKFAVDEQLHHVLLQQLTGQQELAPVQNRERVQSDRPSQEIAWPPMVHLYGLSDDEGDSSGKLKEKFAQWAPSHAFPLFDHRGFQHQAVLLFTTPADDHYLAFEHACSLQNESRDAHLVEWAEFQRWKERKVAWAKQLCKRFDFHRRLLATEKARQNERVKHLAREAEEQKRKNVALTADKEKEVMRRQEEESRSQRLVATLEAEQRENSERLEAQRRAADNRIKALESALANAHAQQNAEQQRQSRAQQEMLQAFGSEIEDFELTNFMLREAQKAAETKMRNTQGELAQLKNMVAQREREMQKALKEQQAEAEHHKAQAAAHAQTEAEKEAEERRAVQLKDLQEEMAREKYKFQAQLEEKEKEVTKARCEAEDSGIDQGEYMALVGENQRFKQGLSVLDEAIFNLYSGTVLSTTTQRFQIYKPGQLSRAFLKKQGLNLPPKDPNTASEAQLQAYFEFENWQSILNSSEPNFDIEYPRLELDVAFVSEGGKYTKIREHDEPAREQKPIEILQKDKDGNKLSPKLIFRPPLPARKAEFVRSIRCRFKNATAILNHIREKANELLNHTDHDSGYSEIKILWDTEQNQEMTPAQKVAFLLQHTGVLGTEKKWKLAREAPGFER